MCGIAGFVDLNSRDAGFLSSTVKSMTEAIVHRGPDDCGRWVDPAHGVGLGHRRLSIVDLSPAGHQPMVSASGRYVLIFNGEIYNHLSLRAELELTSGVLQWRGHSDTETLLAGIEKLGLEDTLRRCVGMFALALWDRVSCRLYLARDRFGEKPLYFGLQKGVFLFGSELKALKAHPNFRADVDRNVLTLLLRHNYIPAPYCIYQGIRKLTPGSILEVHSLDSSDFQLNDDNIRIWSYWSLLTVAQNGRSDPFSGSDEDAVAELESILYRSIGQQMVADVPVGAFLSGGVDSSTVVALMQANSSRKVNTFSIGFHESGYDEAVHAAAVARHLGTNHTEFYVTPTQALEVIPCLATLYDEPFADSSQVPTLLLSELTRRHVTVSLSGDGGDELFGGYRRYIDTEVWWRRLQRFPGGLRELFAKLLATIPPSRWDTLGDLVSGVSCGKLGVRGMGSKLDKLAVLLTAKDYASFYKQFISHWPRPTEVVHGSFEPATNVSAPLLQLGSIFDEMMALDSVSYLPDDILCKVDRASMGVSLESRIPLLDHRVAEFAWRLPQHMKLRQGCGKWILKQVLYKYVPQPLIDRPKKGFSIPLDSWLRGPLRDWAEELLSEKCLQNKGFFDPAPIRTKWREHLSGRRNWSSHLWDVISFQSWLEANA